METFDDQEVRRRKTKLYRSAVQYGKCYTVNVSFSLFRIRQASVRQFLAPLLFITKRKNTTGKAFEHR